jgi:DNA-binding transcriptional MerR regulator
MRIGTLATATGTTTKTLRYYEEAGLLAPPERSDNGYRDYPDSAALNVNFIRSGQAVGLTLAQIKELLTLRRDGRPPCSAATELLDKRLAEISRTIDELEALRHDLEELRSRAIGLDPADCDPDSICHIINPDVCQCGKHDLDSDARGS